MSTLLIAGLSWLVMASSARLESVSLEERSGQPAIRLSGNVEPEVKVMVAHQPYRLIVDWAGSTLAAPPADRDFATGPVRRLSVRQIGGAQQTSRIVIELRTETAFQIRVRGKDVWIELEGAAPGLHVPVSTPSKRWEKAEVLKPQPAPELARRVDKREAASGSPFGVVFDRPPVFAGGLGPEADRDRDHARGNRNPEQAQAEKAHAEQAHAEKAHAEKAHAEKAHAEKAHAEKAHAEKAHAEKAHADRAAPRAPRRTPAALATVATVEARRSPSTELGPRVIEIEEILDPRLAEQLDPSPATRVEPRGAAPPERLPIYGTANRTAVVVWGGDVAPADPELLNRIAEEGAKPLPEPPPKPRRRRPVF